MFRFYLRQLFKAFFPRSRRRSRRAIRKAVLPYRPHMEPLEDRWLPAVVTYTSATALLDFTANASITAPVTVTCGPNPAGPRPSGSTAV